MKNKKKVVAGVKVVYAGVKEFMQFFVLFGTAMILPNAYFLVKGKLIEQVLTLQLNGVPFP